MLSRSLERLPISSPPRWKQPLPKLLLLFMAEKTQLIPSVGFAPGWKGLPHPRSHPFLRAPQIQWLNDMGLKGWGLRLNSGQVQSLSQLQSSQGHWSFLGNWNAIQLLPLPNPASFTPSRYWCQGYSHTQVCLRVGCLGKWVTTLAQSQKANEISKCDLLQMRQHHSTIIKWAEETKWMNQKT